MFTFVILLSILSLPKVWLKPTVEQSELSSTAGIDETRSKRQAAFFDLLNQAIEKYGNCADEHLAPLKALANYKKYETFSYPEQFFQPSHTMVDHPTNPNKNYPNLKCTKVNLCSIQNQQSHTPSGYNSHSLMPGEPLHNGINIPKQNISPYYSTNTNNKLNVHMSGANRFGFGNVPTKFNSQYYMSRNNLKTHFPLNQDVINRFYYDSMTANRGQNNTTIPPATLNNTFEITSPASEIKNCTYLDDNTENRENNIETTNSSHTAEIHLSKKVDKGTAAEKVKKCFCLNTALKDEAGGAEGESSSLFSNMPNSTVSSDEFENSNHNISYLFQKLDEFVHHVNNDDLKQVIEQLKTFKSAFEINSSDVKSTTKDTSNSTVTLLPSNNISYNITMTTQEPSLVRTQVTTTPSKANTKKANLKTTKISLEDQFIENVKRAFKYQVTSNPKSVKTTIKPTSDSKSKKFLDKYNILQRLAALRHKFLNLKDHTGDDANMQKLVRLTNEMNAVLTLMAKTTNQKVSEQKFLNETKEVSIKNNETVTTNDTNKATTDNDDKLENTKWPLTISNSSTIINRNDSKITISITSEGSFKNLHLEEYLSPDKKLEISEKEKLNTATPSSEVQTLDMIGSDSNQINILQQPPKKDYYMEPILSEICSGNSKFSTKPPLTIYLDEIEKKPLKLKKIPINIWKSFQSSAVDDESQDEETFSIKLMKGCDYEGRPYTKESEIMEHVRLC